MSTFTAGMYPHEPMSGHILPVITSWHLGIELVHLAGATTGQLDPVKFWVAWERGAELTSDVFADAWRIGPLPPSRSITWAPPTACRRSIRLTLPAASCHPGTTPSHERPQTLR